MKYLKEFATTSQYEAYTADTANFIKPNVSLCKDGGGVHYNPYAKPVETRVVATFNVTSTSEPTPISFVYNQGGHFVDGTSGFSAIEIDGVELPSVVSAYTFSTTGNHTVKYTLLDQTTITVGAFSECENLTQLAIPNGVTTIGTGACSGSYNMSSITLPDSVTTIEQGAFSSCVSLTSIDIPSGVTSIESVAFYSSSGLTSVTVNATTPPTLGQNVFNDNASGRKIYVPSASVNDYKAATNWSTYASDIEPIS